MAAFACAGDFYCTGRRLLVESVFACIAMLARAEGGAARRRAHDAAHGGSRAGVAVLGRRSTCSELGRFLRR